MTDALLAAETGIKRQILDYRARQPSIAAEQAERVRLEPVLRETPPTTPSARKAAKAPPPRPADEIEI